MSTFNEVSLKRLKTFNQGLERLNDHILLNKDIEGEEYHESPIDQDIKEMQTLLKLISYSAKDFHLKWAIIILLTNIYNCFTVSYYLGISGSPEGIWLGFEFLSELLLIVDLSWRIIMRNTVVWKRMWMLHESMNWLFIISSSFPYTLLSILVFSDTTTWWAACFKLPKLLRFSQFSTFFTNMRIVQRSAGMSWIEVLKLLLILLGITHFAGCLWLGIARLEEFHGDDEYWMEPWIIGGATEFEIYIDALFWATSTLTSIGFGDVTPVTPAERTVSISVMVLGATTYAAIFGTLVVMLVEKNFKEVETQQKLERAKQWCQVRKLPADTRIRVFSYYSLIRTKFSHLMDDTFIEELPLSLKTEISLFLHKEMIPKVKLFELGDPAFMMGIIRYMRPKLFMAGDFIVKQGDISEDLFFVRIGAVEVLATDNESVIAILEEGSFFGEIGLFLDTTRSVSVRARTATLISSISKERLNLIMRNFPDYSNFLRRISEQRLRTTDVADIDMSHDIEEDDDHAELNRHFITQVYSAITFNKSSTKHFIKRYFSFKELTKKDMIIDPLSSFSTFWGFLLISSFSFYVFYVPLIIAFDINPSGWLFYLDLGAFVIYLLDIPINANTAIISDVGGLDKSKNSIRKNYMNSYLITDMISIAPIDFLLIMFEFGYIISAYFRVIRFIKYRRIFNVLKIYKTHATYSISVFRLLQSFVYFVFFSHISACLFFALIRIQEELGSDTRFDSRNFINAFSEQDYQQYDPFMSLPVVEQYAHMLYWSYSITATGAYGDIIAVTIPEKIFNMIIMILSKFFVAFILAEAATVMTNSNRPYTDHLSKLGLMKEWMVYTKLPHELKKRVMKYYELLWSKLKGHDDDEILKDLPESLATDIKTYLFEGVATSGFFPKDQPGPIQNILKKCKVAMTCKGENIISEGEIGLEMYFIVEGEAEVISSAGVPLNLLTKGAVFGEMALLKIVPSLRGATVRARTSLTLAVLSLDDFKFVMDLYPEFATQVRLQAAERERMNRTTLQKASIEAMLRHRRKSMDIDFSLPFTEEKQNFIAEDATISVEPSTYVYMPIESSKKLSVRTVYESKVPKLMYFLLWLWSVVFTPYQIAFRVEYEGWILAMEVFSVTGYVFFSLYFFGLYKLKIPKLKYANKKMILAKAIHHLIIAIPFALILSLTERNTYLEIALGTIRITNFYSLIEFFRFMKQKMTLFNVTRILEVLVIYFVVSHINACMFIRIGMDEPVEDSWMSRIPSPQSTGERTPDSEELTNQIIYIHGLYWSIVTISHIGTGDLTPVSVTERVYTCLAFLFGCFTYAILFGNISSLVSAFASKVRSRLQDSYNYILDFLQKKNLQKSFLRPVSDYFNYLWYENKGINEQELLKHLPSSLMADIQVHRYAMSIHNSQVFKTSDGEIHTPLAKSIFKVLTTKYYLTGDTIIHAGDKNYDFYILLDGEVQVVNIEGKKVLATIGTGGHFGEANLLFNWARIRTASVVATAICQIGVIPKEKFEIMLDAFPEWHEMLVEIATDRMKATFSRSDLEAVAKELDGIRNTLTQDPDYQKRTQKKTNKLIALGIAELLKEPPPNRWFVLSILHLVLLVYSALVIPLQQGFGIEIQGWLLVMEILCVSESLVFFLVNCRYSVIIKARKELEFRDIISYYYHHFIFEDLVAISPFNFLFPLIGVDEPVYVTVPLQLLRVLAVLRIPSLLEKIEIYSRHLAGIITIFKSVLFVIFLTHWSSCLWYFTARHESGSNWITYFQFQDELLGEKYLYSVYYTMNIVTSLGYGDLFPTTDVERFLTIFIILLGDALFAVAFGLMATAVSNIKSEFSDFLENLKAPSKILHKTHVPQSIVKRLETYYAFNAALNQTFGPTDFRTLYEHLPPSIVGNIIYECNKNLLKKLPLISKANSNELIEQLSVSLTPKIFFPHDYVIYKNDIGEEMYFIIQGSVNVLSPDGKRIVKTLSKGDYIGEVALITNSRRLCSVVSSTLCLMYSLHKKDFLNIIQTFPEIMDEIQFEAEKRQKEAGDNAPPDEENYDDIGLNNALQMYSAIGSSLFSKKNTRKLTAFTGIQNFNSEIAIDRSEDVPHKRRPHIRYGHERRLSQVSLGKEMVLSRFSRLKMQWTMQED